MNCKKQSVVIVFILLFGGFLEHIYRLLHNVLCSCVTDTDIVGYSCNVIVNNLNNKNTCAYTLPTFFTRSPDGDLPDGADRIRQPQRFEQQDSSVDFTPSAYNAMAATRENRGPFLGSGVITADFSSRSMRADPLPDSHAEVAAVAAAGPAAAAAAAALALAVEEDDARHRWGAEVQAGTVSQLQREVASPSDNSGDNGDGGHEEEGEEEEEDTRDGEATDENKADSNDATNSVMPAAAATAETTAFLLPPPPPPDASLAFAAVAATGSGVGRVAVMEEARPEDHHEGLTRTVGALPTNSENVLQRMAEACQQAGVALVSTSFVHGCCVARLGVFGHSGACTWVYLCDGSIYIRHYRLRFMSVSLKCSWSARPCFALFKPTDTLCLQERQWNQTAILNSQHNRVSSYNGRM